MKNLFTQKKQKVHTAHSVHIAQLFVLITKRDREKAIWKAETNLHMHINKTR